jgi:pimeloyl-ACP methyl ester carboxylesterase
VAIELAIRHPEKLRSLTLITPFTDAGSRLLAVSEVWCALAAVDADLLGRALLPWLFSPALLANASTRERTRRGLSKSLARVSPEVVARSAAGMRAWSGSRSADLGAITAPTLVIAAGADLLTPDSGSVATAIPGARCLVIPDAGHAVAIEAADRVGTALVERVARHARSR